MTKVLLLVAGDNGTIGSCSLNLYEALKKADSVDVKCAVVHHFKDGHLGFSDAEFFDKEYAGGFKKQIQWLKSIKDRFKPDITISTLFSVNTLNLISGGNDKKIGIFHSPHKQARSKGLKIYVATLLQYLLLYPRLDKLCCVSREVYNSLSSFPTISDKRKKVVYNIHNLNRIISLSQKGISVADERKIFNKPTIIYCGRLDFNKAPDRALKAFATANIEKETQLVFMGEDQEKMQATLMNEAETLGVSQRIHFLGRKDNPYPYIKASKALISSSYSEGLPGVIIEALALNIPVVTTNSSMGIWEIFSCLNNYDEKLSEVYETSYGVITSNLSHLDKVKYEKDSANLALGIEKVLRLPTFKGFKFGNLVSEKKIVKQLLSNL